MYKKLESINTKIAQDRFVALQNSVKTAKSEPKEQLEHKTRKIVNGNEEYFSENSSHSSAPSDLRTFLSEKNVDSKSKQNQQGIKRRNFMKKTPPKRRKIVNRNVQPSSSIQNTSNISDLRTYLSEKNVDDLKLKCLIQKLEEENSNLQNKLEEIGQEKISIEELSVQKSRDYEKLQSDLLATKIDVTTLKFEVS